MRLLVALTSTSGDGVTFHMLGFPVAALNQPKVGLKVFKVLKYFHFNFQYDNDE